MDSDRLKPETLTAATDYVLAAAAFAGSLGLLRAAEGRRSVRFWAAGFLGVATAALAGGTWHALESRLQPRPAELLWKATLGAAGIAGFFLIAGAAVASLPRHAAKWVVGAAAVKLAVFLVRAAASDAFDPVVFDSVGTLAALFVLQSIGLARKRARSAPWVFAGIGVSILATAIEAFRPALPAPFGADAAYHLVQLAGLSLFYRGALLFFDG